MQTFALMWHPHPPTPPLVRICSHFDGPLSPPKCERNNWMAPSHIYKLLVMTNLLGNFELMALIWVRIRVWASITSWRIRVWASITSWRFYCRKFSSKGYFCSKTVFNLSKKVLNKTKIKVLAWFCIYSKNFKWARAKERFSGILPQNSILVALS